MLYCDGNYYTETIKRKRIIESEIEAAVRGAGYTDLEEIVAVVLENDGSLSVLPKKSISNHLIEDLR